MDNSHDIIYGLSEVALFLTNQCGETDYSQTVEDACAELSKHRWISIEERLPEDGRDILAYYADGIETRIIACNYYKGVWFDCLFNTLMICKNISHWMPLPEPPQEG